MEQAQGREKYQFPKDKVHPELQFIKEAKINKQKLTKGNSTFIQFLLCITKMSRATAIYHGVNTIVYEISLLFVVLHILITGLV